MPSKLIPNINLESFLNSLYEGIVYQDAEGEIVFCNKAAEEILELTAEEMTGRSFIHPGWRCIYEDGSDFPCQTHPTMIALQTGRPQRNVVIGVYKPGDELCWIRINADPLFTGNSNKPSGVIASFVDITERKTSELKDDEQKKELVFQNDEKEKRAVELVIANKELAFQNDEKEKRAAELIIANKELAFQNNEKEKRAAELIIANKELAFQNNEKEKRAAELIIANKELAFQNDEKEKRAAELIIANKELAFQNNEKEKRAAELIIANKELAASNAELELFAYITSHDLQEPLRMVSSFMNLLEKKMDGQLDETTKQYIHFAVDGAERMKTLIKDLLQYSRVGANKENFTVTDLYEVMQYTNRVLEEDIKKTQAVITVRPMPAITANKALISQLFINLVSNALKYHGDKEPEIEVGCTEEPAEWNFYVKDNGIGIDPKFFDKIFIIFQRLHFKSEYSGTGTGLAICKKIVEIHNGKIWVESGAGKGSTFYISLPKQNV